MTILSQRGIFTQCSISTCVLMREGVRVEVQMWPLDRVVVRDRARSDLGDLSGLKDSLTVLGQLQPIAARPDGTLVFGHRRLTAARELGWTEIAVRLFTDDSAQQILRAEQDENTQRKALTPVEAAKLRRQLAEVIRPEVIARRNTRYGLHRSSNLDERSTTRHEAAKSTGYGATTLDKVDEILTAAENPAEHPEVREEAKRQADELSKPGAAVDPAHKAVKQARSRVQRKRDHDLLPGQRLQQPKAPPPVFPLERRLTDGINKGQGLAALASEVQDREDLDLTSDTITVLRRRLKDEAAERNQLHRALGTVLAKRKASLS